MRVTTDEEGERLLISSAGIWQAQDLLATLQDRTLRGIALEDAELKYTAPELLTGRNADVRSDVFTMGVVAYEMATATLPYDGGSMQELLGNMLRGQPADPSILQPTLPAGSSAAILRALRPSSDERFATAFDFGHQLL
jgi:serine/threonine-protein kinase